LKTFWDKLMRIKGPLLALLISISVYLSFRYLLGLVLPFLIAYFLAWIIRPVTEALYRRFRMPRVLGGTLSLLLLFAVFGTGICLLINILIKQAIAFIRNLPIYLNLIANKLDRICIGCDELFGLEKGTLRTMVDDNLMQTMNRLKNNLMPEITEHTISITVGVIAFLGILLIIFVSAVLMVKELPSFQERYGNHNLYKDFHRITGKLSDAGAAYLRSQIIIMIIVALVCILGLTLLRSDYAVLLGIGIAIMDALPVIGSGMIFIPWAIIMLMNSNIYAAAILITTYLLCQILREVLEPKLIGNRIGIKPLYTLIAMYIGVKLFSFIGFILGPIGLVIITTVYKVVNEKTKEFGSREQITYEED
jgi:sporulation integral membrane protein YtvI